MKHSNYFTLSLFVSSLLILSGHGPAMAQGGDLPVKHFSHPDRIRYDGQCMTIDGKDMVIFSGSFHYFRCPKALWPDRFQKIKEAGFNAVESYVPWNWHEREMPTDLKDTSKINLDDLRDWLHMASEQYGLYIIIRPGPYICAEWQCGGYPRWLMNKNPTDGSWLRSDDPDYLKWCKYWYDAVCPVIAREQITRKPPGSKGVILFQIENEYNFWGAPWQVKANQLRALYQDAVNDGIDVPIFTCWTRQARGSKDPILSQVFDGSNEYCYWNITGLENDMDRLRAEQPNAPLMIPELQGGWFTKVGGRLVENSHELGAAQITATTLAAWSHGVRISNYYMLFGGTNFGGWNGRDITTTYDYYAPIRECGGVGDKYAAVKALGQLIQEHGEGLARAVAIATIKTSEDDGTPMSTVVAQCGTDSALYLFCSSSKSGMKSAKLTMQPIGKPVMDVNLRSIPDGWSMLYLPPGKTDSADGTWYPKSVTMPQRPAKVPASIRLASALTRPDPGGVDWAKVPTQGQSLIAQNRIMPAFAEYRTTAKPDASLLTGHPTLLVDTYAIDQLCVSVNGHLAPCTLGENGQTVVDLDGLLHEGDNPVVILFNDQGNNGFGNMNGGQGVRNVSLSHRQGLTVPLQNWRVKQLASGGDATPWVAADFDDSTWDSFVLNRHTIAQAKAASQAGAAQPKYPAIRILFNQKASAVFRSNFELTPEMMQLADLTLSFQHIDDSGIIYVNGIKVGSSHDWAKPVQVAIRQAARVGHNVVAVVVTNDNGEGGLTGEAALAGGIALPSPSLPLELAAHVTGDAEHWQSPKATDDGWTSVALNTIEAIPRESKPNRSVNSALTPSLDKSASQPLLTWYRCEFNVPAAAANVWVPWHVRLDAVGDGYLYLNGHPLGRYWNVGPQREFYLPECWLNIGNGQKNVLVLSLRPPGKPVSLSAVEIAPYASMAEVRPK